MTDQPMEPKRAAEFMRLAELMRGAGLRIDTGAALEDYKQAEAEEKARLEDAAKKTFLAVVATTPICAGDAVAYVSAEINKLPLHPLVYDLVRQAVITGLSKATITAARRKG